MSPKYLLVLVILRQTVTWQSQVIFDKLVTRSRSRSELQSLAICYGKTVLTNYPAYIFCSFEVTFDV